MGYNKNEIFEDGHNNQIIMDSFEDGQVLHAQSLTKLENAILKNRTDINDIKSNIKQIEGDSSETKALSELISFKGLISINKLESLLYGSRDDIYKINDSNENIEEFNYLTGMLINNGCFIYCKKSFNAFNTFKKTTLPYTEFKNYWSIKTSILDDATENKPGLVNTQNQQFAGQKTFNNGITISEKVDFSNSKIYRGNDPLYIPKETEIEKYTANQNSKIEETYNHIYDLDERLSNSEFKNTEITNKLISLDESLKAENADRVKDDSIIIGEIEKNRTTLRSHTSNLEEHEKQLIKHTDQLTGYGTRLDTVEVKTQNNASNIEDLFKNKAQIFRITDLEFAKLLKNNECQSNMFYFIVAAQDNPSLNIKKDDLLRLNIGSFMIAQKGNGGGSSNGFPYTFPIIF